MILAAAVHRLVLYLMPRRMHPSLSIYIYIRYQPTLTSTTLQGTRLEFKKRCACCILYAGHLLGFHHHQNSMKVPLDTVFDGGRVAFSNHQEDACTTTVGSLQLTLH